MKIKNEVLVNSIGVLSKMNNEELTVKTSYKLAKNIKAIEKELIVFNEEKQKFINKYSEKDEEGKNKVNEDGTVNIIDTDNWSKDYNELLDLENNISIELINIDDLAKSDLKISAGEIALIDYLIK